MTAAEARERFATARVARLATAGPHLVPICFAVDGDTIYSAVDHKPKRSPRLQRLRNVEADPRVALLADHYDEDWTRLWWVRADGAATVGDLGERALDLLTARYPQYAERPPAGPLLTIRVERWSGWASS